MGKSHTIRALAEAQRFPLSSFVWVDPDQIRHCLPEFDMLVHYDAARAGDRTRKEAGMLSEILTLAALEGGQSVIVDGSLRDAKWYEEYFAHLRETYPGIKIAIFHVTAPREAVLARAAVSATSRELCALLSFLVARSYPTPFSLGLICRAVHRSRAESFQRPC